MTRRIWVVAWFVFGGLVGYEFAQLNQVTAPVTPSEIVMVEAMSSTTEVEPQTQPRWPARNDTYQLWKGSPHVPLSVVFKGRCLHAEDSAAHLVLKEYGAKTVFGCRKHGYRSV